jgi:hypothetical protein
MHVNCQLGTLVHTVHCELYLHVTLGHMIPLLIEYISALTVIPRGINLYPRFVACALDRQGAYPLRLGINHFLITDTLLPIILRATCLHLLKSILALTYNVFKLHD